MSVITTQLELALSHLEAGKPVAIPTETVYGLAALANHEEAIKAVFRIKGRPLNHPLILHVAPKQDLFEWVEEIPEYAQQLMDVFWPGPLTLVFRAKKGAISPLVTGGQDTVAIRCPAHPLAQELLSRLSAPVVAPSANPFGKVSPTTAVHVQDSFLQESLLILDGGRCSIGIESTIVDATQRVQYQILRHGLIHEQELSQVVTQSLETSPNTLRVPGKLESHYQPVKPLYYFEKYDDLCDFVEQSTGDIYVIANQKPLSISPKHFHTLGKTSEEAAFHLYFQLRHADASGAQCIAIELPPATLSWQGVRERILKAGKPFSSAE